jgi:hypothetical protein
VVTRAAGYAAVVATAVALQVAAATTRLPTLGSTVGAAVRRRPVLRSLLLAGWPWVGWHMFARADF